MAYRLLALRRCFGSWSRGPYGKVTDAIVSEFERIVGPKAVLTSDLESYNNDWLNTVTGKSEVVIRPSSVEEVSALMSTCYAHRLAVVPQGGNTGLVAGATPLFDEVIINMSRMKKVISVDPVDGTVCCEAGAVLSQVQEAVAEAGLITPYDLGSKGTCQIGGNVSTCAGGLRLIRYGSMLGNLLGIQAVLADGTVVDGMGGLRKDNCGYHIREVFVGAEGTLGIVTGAVIACPQAPTSTHLTLIGLKNYSDVVECVGLARRALGEVISAMELMDDETVSISTQALNQQAPISQCPFYLMVETHGSSEDHDSAKVDYFLQLANPFIIDGTSTSQPSTIRSLWSVRENLAVGTSQGCHLYTYDLTFPIASMYDIVEETKKRLQDQPVLSVTGYGHIGDGNIHLNVRCKAHDEVVRNALEPWVYEWTAARGGSISSEHGIGLRKAAYLPLARSAGCLKAYRTLKTALDPLNLLNPYKLLPPPQ